MSGQIKVCHIATAHPQEDRRIFEKECTSLAKAGYDVYLVSKGTRYKKNNVTLVGLPYDDRKKIWRRIKFAYQVFCEVKKIDADIYHFHEPDFMPYAYLLHLMGKKVIFDSHENHPVELREHGPWGGFVNRIIASLYKYIEIFVCKRIDAVIYVTPNMKERSSELNSVAVMVTNYPIYKEMPSVEIKKNRLVFAGGISELWNHQNILKAIENISGITYTLCGPAENAYLDLLKNMKAWEKVDFLGKIPNDDVFPILSESLIGVAVAAYCRNTDWKVGTLGNTKIFEEMMTGLPVICTDFDLWREFVDRYECGICVNPTDVGEITSAIEYLIAHPDEVKKMGENGRRAVREEFNWDTQAKKLIELYSDILSSKLE